MIDLITTWQSYNIISTVPIKTAGPVSHTSLAENGSVSGAALNPTKSSAIASSPCRRPLRHCRHDPKDRMNMPRWRKRLSPCRMPTSHPRHLSRMCVRPEDSLRLPSTVRQSPHWFPPGRNADRDAKRRPQRKPGSRPDPAQT